MKLSGTKYPISYVLKYPIYYQSSIGLLQNRYFWKLRKIMKWLCNIQERLSFKSTPVFMVHLVVTVWQNIHPSLAFYSSGRRRKFWSKRREKLEDIFLSSHIILSPRMLLALSNMAARSNMADTVSWKRIKRDPLYCNKEQEKGMKSIITKWTWFCTPVPWRLRKVTRFY